MKIDALNGWRAAEAVIRNRGIAPAAEELAVSRAAVAAQIRTLEARIGHPIFRRRSAGLEPTEDVLRVSHRLSSAFSELAALQEELSAAGNPRRVALTVTQFFADTWLPKYLPDMLREMPGLDLRIDSTPEVVSLDTGEITFAFRFMSEPEPPLTSIDLFPGAFAPVCTPGFAERFNLSETTETLEGVPLIHLPDLSTDPTQAEWATWSEKTGLPLGPNQEANVGYSKVASALGLARSESGLVLGVLAGCFDAVAKGELVLPLGPKSVVYTSYWHRLVWRGDRRLTGLRRKFRDFVEARAERDRIIAEKAFGGRNT
ncbi:LysR substrate-binding domain-containing protein [Psychromarinibacter sp. C21-152]|uniref:LysR substrate-binding domain-containing protein n=1 Tax=Psychromarinibacter sediminicola TaxID=3033385 RepID=A0AAE3NWQ2_9RHOB|nr:LysR substrate-binding domain-containing protein [Psychromarinibacter sediminicola]MDF0603681.1 LysR substrate-binding domain-containing protein [Psychromarinibacter sediminicola]